MATNYYQYTRYLWTGRSYSRGRVEFMLSQFAHVLPHNKVVLHKLTLYFDNKQ